MCASVCVYKRNSRGLSVLHLRATRLSPGHRPPPAQQPAGTRRAVTRPPTAAASRSRAVATLPLFVPPPDIPLECSPRLPPSTPPPPLLCSSRRPVTKATATAVERYTLQHAQSTARRSHARSQHRPRERGFAKIILRALLVVGGG